MTGDTGAAYGYQAAPAGYPAPEQDWVTRQAVRVAGRSPAWLGPLAVLGCAGAAIGYTLVTHPAAASADGTPTCLLKWATGFDCPGCGGTRAAWYLLHGDLPDAARNHLLFTLAVPFLIYLYVAWAADRVFHVRLPKLRLSGRALGVFIAAWGVFSVLRNLPWAPFTWFYV